MDSHIGSYTDLDQYGVLVCACVIEENIAFILLGELFTNFEIKCHLNESMCFFRRICNGFVTFLKEESLVLLLRLEFPKSVWFFFISIRLYLATLLMEFLEAIQSKYIVSSTFIIVYSSVVHFFFIAFLSVSFAKIFYALFVDGSEFANRLLIVPILSLN